MKKILTAMLALALSLTLFASCGTANDTGSGDPTVDAYIQAAQGYIDSGDTAKAIEILEEGIGITDNAKLKEMLAGISTSESATDEVLSDATDSFAEVTEATAETTVAAEPEKPDFYKYAGTWMSGSECYDIVVTDSEINIKGGGNFYVDKYISLAEFEDGEYSFSQSGYYDTEYDITFELSDDVIYLTLVKNEEAQFGDVEQTQKYILKKYVHSKATLDIKPYMNGEYYATYMNSDASIIVGFEAGMLYFDYRSSDIYAWVSHSMPTYETDHFYITPDEENGRSVTYRFSEYDHYRIDDNQYYMDDFGNATLTFTFDYDTITVKYVEGDLSDTQVFSR